MRKFIECSECGNQKTEAARGMCEACYGKWKRNRPPEQQIKRSICSIEGCDKYVVTLGLCDKHRQRLASNGTTEKKYNDWGAREKHPLYKIWTQHRRFNYKHPLCEEWHKGFWVFVDNLKERPSDNHHLRPIDKSVPIGEGNWQWVEAISKVIGTEEMKEYTKNWAKADRAQNPDKYKNKYLHMSFGITLEQYNCMSDAQGGRCKICAQPETMKNPKTGEAMMLAVDHCHTTGDVRGLLCASCNKALGGFKDSIHLLESAIQYLKVGSPLTDYNGQQTGAQALL